VLLPPFTHMPIISRERKYSLRHFAVRFSRFSSVALTHMKYGNLYTKEDIFSLYEINFYRFSN